jgi:hypothetical protein
MQAKSGDGAASGIVADRPRKLADAGVPTRDAAPRRPPDRYGLTAPAILLVPVFADLGRIPR